MNDIRWVKEWDGALNMVRVENGPAYNMVSMTYGDGTVHVVRRSYFESIDAGRANDFDLNPRPAQCWSPKL